VPIFSVLTGGAIAGILGAILAVPIAAAVRVTLDALFPEETSPPNPLSDAERESGAISPTPSPLSSQERGRG
jgi:predicted PurR-regulated permease PerM